MSLWIPDENGTGPLQVDASAAFLKPVKVETTREEVYRMVQRLKGEPKEKCIALSNEKFKKCVAYSVDDTEGMEAFCGDVIVFYCCRVVLDGRGIPFV